MRIIRRRGTRIHPDRMKKLTLWSRWQRRAGDIIFQIIDELLLCREPGILLSNLVFKIMDGLHSLESSFLQQNRESAIGSPVKSERSEKDTHSIEVSSTFDEFIFQAAVSLIQNAINYLLRWLVGIDDLNVWEAKIQGIHDLRFSSQQQEFSLGWIRLYGFLQSRDDICLWSQRRTPEGIDFFLMIWR